MKKTTPKPERSGIKVTGMRKLTLVPMIAATYFMVAGGPYGLSQYQCAENGYLALTADILVVTPLLAPHRNNDGWAS